MGEINTGGEGQLSLPVGTTSRLGLLSSRSESSEPSKGLGKTSVPGLLVELSVGVVLPWLDDQLCPVHCPLLEVANHEHEAAFEQQSMQSKVQVVTCREPEMFTCLTRS